MKKATATYQIIYRRSTTNNNLAYIRCGDYYILALCFTDADAISLGKYGRMKRAYLREHRPVLWSQMILSEILFPHLREIDETANCRMAQIMSDMLASSPVPDKAPQQFAWVRHTNTLKSQAEEIIFDELIYH